MRQAEKKYKYYKQFDKMRKDSNISTPHTKIIKMQKILQHDGCENNIARTFFSECYQIRDESKRPMTNIFITHARCDKPVLGSIYFIHGYGGSPVEPCLKLPMQYALRSGFDVVAIEGIDLSATCGMDKDINTMTLERQKKALKFGLAFCRNNPDLSAGYKIAWAHSISCRALSDLVVDSTMVGKYFDEYVLNNPYFLAPPKVGIVREKFLRRDPTGKRWKDFLFRPLWQSRQIENLNFQIPTCLNNVWCPLPYEWRGADNNLALLARKMSHFVPMAKISFVLGTADDMADFHQNLQLYNGLKIPCKSLTCIEGGNHSFENALPDYEECARGIIDAAKCRILSQSK